VVGFSQAAYRGLETGERKLTSYLLNQGKVNFMFTTPMELDHPASEHVRKHGDGVRDIALRVENADQAFEEAIQRGARVAEEPHDVSDEHGTIRQAAIHTYGDTIHSLISYKGYSGPFLPGFSPAKIPGKGAGILRIDHIVGNVELGQMEYWADFYSRTFGFHRYISFDDKDISTEYSALMSIVMSDDSHSVKFPINEPAPGRRKSHIDEYLEAYHGPGVQHIALLCDNVLQTVARLKEKGMDFLRVPESYYGPKGARSWPKRLFSRFTKIEGDRFHHRPFKRCLVGRNSSKPEENSSSAVLCRTKDDPVDFR
jgi:4-hydroxyphenylpyruvate dioxygenase